MKIFRLRLQLLLLILILPICFALNFNDYVEIGSSSDLLEVGESIGNVRETITEVDLYMLRDFQINTSKGNTTVHQYLRFPDNGHSGNFTSGSTVFGLDERDNLNSYLYFKESEILFQYELEFEQGLKSVINNGILDDLLNKSIYILGEEFLIVEANFIEGLILHLFDGNKEIIFDITNGSRVEIDAEVIEDAVVNITFTNTSDEMTINSILYTLYADAILGDMFIKPGTGAREQLAEPEGMLTDDWDILYEGLLNTSTFLVEVHSTGEFGYKLRWTNQEGIYYDHRLLSNKNTSVGIVYGDDDDDLWFTECMYPNSSPAYNIGDDDYFVLSNCMAAPYNSAVGTDNTCFTHVLRYDNIDENKKELTFTDLGTGRININYSAANEANLRVGGVDYLVKVEVGAPWPRHNNLAIDLNGDGIIASELDNNGYGKVLIGIAGEGLIDLGWQQCMNSSDELTRAIPIERPNSTVAKGNQINYTNISLITLPKEFDEAIDFEVLTTKIVERPNNLIGIEGSRSTNLDLFDGGVLAEKGIFYGLYNTQEHEELEQGLSGYGVFVELYNPNATNEAEDLTFEYPTTQRGSRVFIAHNITPSSPGGGGGGGSYNCTIPENGTSIDRDTILCSGNYNLTTGLTFEPGTENITLDCNHAVLNGLGAAVGINVLEQNNITIKNCILNNYEKGVYLKNSDNIKILNSNVSYAHHAVYLEDSDNNILTDNSAFFSNRSGFFLNSSNYNNLTKNKAYNTGDGQTPWDIGFWLVESSNNFLEQNKVMNNSGSGFRLDWSSNNNSVMHNHVINNSNAGFYSINSTNNRFFYNNATSNACGFEIHKSSDYEIKYNLITNNWGYGLWLGFFGENVSVNYNNIYNNSIYAKIDLASYSHNNLTLNAENNYWGTTNKTLIEERTRYIVDFCPYLDSPWPNGNPVSCNSSNSSNISGLVCPSYSDGIVVHETIMNNKYAIPDNTYENGWNFTFFISVPVNENNISMWVDDWKKGNSNKIVETNNNTKIVYNGNDYKVGSDHDYSESDSFIAVDEYPVCPGMQIYFDLLVKLPVGTNYGTYSTSYGIRSLPENNNPPV